MVKIRMKSTTTIQDIKMNKQPTIITVTGPTCSGKTTFVGELVKTGAFRELKSTTTRPSRVNEVDGVNYYFVTDEQFEKEDLVERVSFAGYKYGLSKHEVETVLAGGLLPLSVVEPGGSMQIENYCKEHGWKNIKVFMISQTSVTVNRLLCRFLEDYKIKGLSNKLLDIYSERIEKHLSEEQNWVHSMDPLGDDGKPTLGLKNAGWDYVVVNYGSETKEMEPILFMDFLRKTYGIDI